MMLATMPSIGYSTNIGVPIINNYPREAYKAGIQNWDIAQDEHGRVYFANNEGLLVYDGSSWKLHPVDNNTIVRSLLIDADRIYVGAQGDIGFFEPDTKGALTYVSLKDKIPESFQNFGDIWKVVRYREGILFRTLDKLFIYEGDEISAHIIDEAFSFVNDQNEKTSLHKLENPPPYLEGSQYQLLARSPVLRGEVIHKVFELGGQFLIMTSKSGIFSFENGEIAPWTTNDEGLLKEHRITCAIRIAEERFAVGTLSGGLFIIGRNGKIIQHLDVNKGLLSNEVIDIFQDAAGNLWLALSNGIDYIEINAPFSWFKPDNNIGGTGYAVQIHRGKIYFGTSNGVYAADWKEYYNPLQKQPFKYVEQTRGQVWNLEVLQNELLLGHHEGAFLVEQGRATALSSNSGAWNFIPISGDRDRMLGGTYNGLNAYAHNGQSWVFENQIKGMIDESCRFLVQDKDGSIWVAHPYRGVYRIVLDDGLQKVESITLYNADNGFPSDWAHVFKIGDGVVFTSAQGIYDYDAGQDSFLLSEVWSEVISPESRVQLLQEDELGNIWFVIDDNVGVIKVQDFGVEKELEKQTFSGLTKQLVGGFEYIYAYDEENVFFPLEQGFMHFNPKRYGLPDTIFQLQIQEVKLGDSTVVFGGWKTEKWQLPVFSHRHNTFTFYYSTSAYSKFNQVEYQYFLEGLDEAWSPWMPKNTKEYTNLSSGRYTFQVRAKNAYGQITETASFEFRIAPPWYLTTIAKTIYFLIAVLGLLTLIFLPRRKFEKEKIILQQEQQETLDKTTREYEEIVAQKRAAILELQKEKLKAEINFQNQELATTTMHLVQNGELINKLKLNLDQLLKMSSNPAVKKEIRSTIKLLDQNAQLDDTWDKFSRYFDQVHVDFLKRLKEAYPHLTPKDQKLCTYLRMNLSTKEIVPLMNISVRGVEVSRYRLRKKLDLDSDTNLNEFMMRF